MNAAFKSAARGHTSRKIPDVDCWYRDDIVAQFLRNRELPDQPHAGFNLALAATAEKVNEGAYDTAVSYLRMAKEQLHQTTYGNEQSYFLSCGIAYACKELLPLVRDQSFLQSDVRDLIVAGIDTYPLKDRRGAYIAAFSSLQADPSSREDWYGALVQKALDDKENGMPWNKWGTPLSQYLADRGLTPAV
ncbi:MAG: hypothetical protein V4621_04550 [Pseudomonadota bacterium]